MTKYKDFLQRYIAELSRDDIFDLQKNIEDAADRNFRLQGPLILYLIETDNINLTKYHPALYQECLLIKHYIDQEELLPHKYEKVIRAFKIEEKYGIR